jgi:predicted PurR-regulated permease PerM
MEVKLPFYAKLVIVLLGIVLTVFVMITAKPVLVPLLISGFLAVLISPLTSWLERLRLPKALAVIISLVALLALLAGLIYFFYNQLLGFADDITALERRAAELIASLNEFMQQQFEGAVPISMESIQTQLFQYLSENTATLTQGVIATATTITMLFIMPVYIFLFLYFRHFLVQFLLMAFADRHREKVQNVIHRVKGVVQNYITGMFLVILILAVLNSIALYSLGVRHALLFAGFAAMLNVIPFLGPFIGATLPILYTLLTTDSLWVPFGVFLAFYFIQLAESNFFTPKIVGGRVSMNPLMTIIALFVGNFIWGLAGMILFIPGMAILKVIFDEVEGMQAWGFLLGDAREARAKKQRRTLMEQIQQVRGRFRV